MSYQLLQDIYSSTYPYQVWSKKKEYTNQNLQLFEFVEICPCKSEKKIIFVNSLYNNCCIKYCTNFLHT